ncbi:MAG: hypothetical protein E6R13_03915 [Spirochaetes bacterium]|nr:MAG: hypothetical protein E6R13_03915 [Spirochaetota bacterium]
MAQHRFFKQAEKVYGATYDNQNDQVVLKASSLQDKNLLVELIIDSNNDQYNIFPAHARNGLKIFISHNDYLSIKRRLDKYTDLSYKIKFDEEGFVNPGKNLGNSI